MEGKKVQDVVGKGMPKIDNRLLFNAEGDYSNMTFSYIEIMPGYRIPETGYSKHDADEYSYFVSGSVKSYSGGKETTEVAGNATFIPKGEEHWCINEGDEPCVIICAMIK